jgi:hypothetical protein
MAIKRLAQYLDRRLGVWRTNAAGKQKKVRRLETRVRDLEKSRATWKARAMKAEQELGGVRPKRGSGRDMTEPEPDEVLEGEYLPGDGKEGAEPARVRCHQYSLDVMEEVLGQLLIGLSSLRGSCRMAAWRWGDEHAPALSTVRSWLFRMGLSLLRQPLERREDWILILDLTVEMGTDKVCVILAISQERLQALSRRRDSCCLSHQDVVVVALEVLEHSSGEVIAQQLEKQEARLGRICQIVADGGSDVSCGIERFRRDRPWLHRTYDVTHQVALWFKHALENDALYQDFRRRCGDSTRALRQTPLHFLTPPVPRSKARWQQMGELVIWAGKVIAYADRGQFQGLTPGYRLDSRVQQCLRGVLSDTERRRLDHRVWRDFAQEGEYLEALRRYLGAQTVETHRRTLCEAGQLGRREFEAHLGWVLGFREVIDDYRRRLEAVEQFQEQLKHKGLRADTKVAAAPLPNDASPALQTLHAQMRAYVERENTGLAEGEIRLSSSDVLESLFGKYKLLSGRSPLKEVSRWVLVLPLLTIRLTRAGIRRALETVSTQVLEQWVAEHFGPSAFARRRSALGTAKKT